MAVISSTEAGAGEGRVAGWLSPDEFRLIEAMCDTFFPSLEPPGGSSEVMTAYFRRSARDLHVPYLVAETLAQENAEAQTEFRQLLALMSSPLSGLLLVGRPQTFLALSQEQREKYLLAMANSPLAQLRQGYQAIKRLASFIYYSVPDPQGVNPNWSALDYTAPEPPPADAPQPIKPLAISEDTTLDADAVVIGSGAGGGVVAAELALAGKSVIVLEKGGYNNSRRHHAGFAPRHPGRRAHHVEEFDEFDERADSRRPGRRRARRRVTPTNTARHDAGHVDVAQQPAEPGRHQTRLRRGLPRPERLQRRQPGRPRRQGLPDRGRPRPGVEAERRRRAGHRPGGEERDPERGGQLEHVRGRLREGRHQRDEPEIPQTTKDIAAVNTACNA